MVRADGGGHELCGGTVFDTVHDSRDKQSRTSRAE